MQDNKYAGSCNSYFQPEYSMIRDIEEYIYSELKDSKYYEGLCEKAPTKYAKELLAEFAEDDRTYAECFIKAYSFLTGMEYDVPAIEKPSVPPYDEAIKERMTVETSCYKLYCEQYLKARNQYIKDLFFTASSVKAVHGMKLALLGAEK